MESRNQLSGAHSLFLACGTWAVNSGYQVWQQAPLPSEPFPQHQTEFLLLLLTLFVVTAKLHLFILCVCVSSMCIYVMLTCMQDTSVEVRGLLSWNSWFSLGMSQTRYTGESGLKLPSLLPPPPKPSDYRQIPIYSSKAYVQTCAFSKREVQLLMGVAITGCGVFPCLLCLFSEELVSRNWTLMWVSKTL